MKQRPTNTACEPCRKLKKPCAPGSPCPRCVEFGGRCVRLASKKRGPKGPWAHKRNVQRAESEENTVAVYGASCEQQPVKREPDTGPARGEIRLGREPKKREPAGGLDFPPFADVFPSIETSEVGLASARSVGPSGVLPATQPFILPDASTFTLADQQFQSQHYSNNFHLLGTGSHGMGPEGLVSSFSPSLPLPTAGLGMAPVVSPYYSPIPPRPPIPYPESLVDTVSQAVSIYFDLVEVPYPMLNKARFLRDPHPTSLLVSSIMLMIPKGLRAAGLPCPSHWRDWDRPMFARVAAEAAALISSGRKTTCDDLAALLNVHIWAIVSGLNRLGGQLLAIVRSLALRDGHLEPPAGSWSVVASRELPVTQLSLSGLTDFQIQKMYRIHWIDFYVKQRIAHLVLALGVLHASWSRDRRSPASLDFEILRRPAHPMPRIWTRSFDPEFDPRGLKDEPEVSEALEFLVDPATAPNPALISKRLLETRLQLPWTVILMRNRLDRFLAACDGDVGSPESTAERDRLSAELEVITLSYPLTVRTAISEGSAEQMIAAYAASSGDAVHAFNTVPLFLILDSMALEVHTSAAAYFAVCEDGASLPGTWRRARDLLADDFTNGGAPAAALLAKCVAATRILEGLSKINPVFLNHASYVFAFRMGCLHAALLWRLQSAGAQSGVIDDIQNDVDVCLSILKAYAGVNPVGGALLSLAERAIRGFSVVGESEKLGQIAQYVEDVDAAAADDDGDGEARGAADELGGMIEAAYGR